MRTACPPKDMPSNRPLYTALARSVQPPPQEMRRETNLRRPWYRAPVSSAQRRKTDLRHFVHRRARPVRPRLPEHSGSLQGTPFGRAARSAVRCAGCRKRMHRCRRAGSSARVRLILHRRNHTRVSHRFDASSQIPARSYGNICPIR